jgi:lysophospholipase L1-like esterase
VSEASEDGGALSPTTRILFVLYWLAYGVVYAGWLFHECDPRDVFQYSTSYLFFLAVMALGFLVPHALLAWRRRVGRPAFRRTLLAALAVFALVYVGAALRYYATQVHPFDPFLQEAPPLFENVPKEKGPSTFRVMAVGGSTTRCATIEVAQRYPSVLRNLLQERYPSRNIEVINAGMDWFTTKHCLIHYVTYGQDWHPDLIVLMEAINDLYRSFSPTALALGPYNERWSHFYGPAIRGADPLTFEEHLFSYSGVLGRLASPWYSELRERAVELPLESYRSLEPFRANLEKWVRSTAANGTRLVLVTQPSLYKDDMSAAELRELEFPRQFCATRVSWFTREYPTARSMKVAMQAFNDVVRQTAAAYAEEYGVGLVDAEARIAKDTQNFTDDVHYTVTGAARVAECVAEAIVASGLVDRAVAK